MGGGWCWILASALVLLSIHLSPVIKEMKQTLTRTSFGKFPGGWVVGGSWIITSALVLLSNGLSIEYRV